MRRCPVCNSDKYRYVSYAEECYGIVEQHGRCNRCGYVIEQCYSFPVDGFEPIIRRGHKCLNKYYPKNKRKRLRMKRKYGIKYGNKDWMLMYI